MYAQTYVKVTCVKLSFSSISPVSLPESTKQLMALRQSMAENVEIPVNPSDVMRGTLYQNSEAEQSSCPSPSPPSQSTESLRERYLSEACIHISHL